MKKLFKNKIIVFVIFLIAILGLVYIQQAITVTKAHQTFENYYAFRGCTKLLKKTDSYGICQLSSGDKITIVNYQNKWYLKGDLPVCYFNFCF